MAKTVCLVTGVSAIADIFTQPMFRDYELKNTFHTKEEALAGIPGVNPEIILVVEGTPSSTGMTTPEFIKKLHRDFPSGRIVYITGEISPNDVSKHVALGDLVQNGIYDFISGRQLSAKEVLNTLSSPATYESVKYLASYANRADVVGDQDVIKNLICIDSIKPGSGKTLLAVNMAVAIAKYGQKKRNGDSPRVAIIDGDLNSLSVGTMLHMESTKYNLREALRLAGTVVDTDGNITGSDEEVQEVRTSIRKCFIKHSKYPNLFALVSTNIPMVELDRICPGQFYFLLKCVYGAFDVVIVDMNSSLEHKTTGPLFALAKRCYFLLDPDYNNLKNNLRYSKDLARLGIKGKIKFVLNRAISPDQTKMQYIEDLEYNIEALDNPDFDITHTIPMADGIMLSNSIFKGTPIVLDLDPSDRELKRAFLTIANENWKIDYAKVKAEEDEYKESLKGGSMKKIIENIVPGKK